jgi:molecular chaperone GrpE
MRKKIEITTDEWHDAEAVTPPASFDLPPEFGDFINPAEEDKTRENGKAADPEADPPKTEAAPSDLAEIQAQLEEALRRAKEAETQLLYVQAEFQNFRRRKEDESRDLAKFTNRELIKALLPIVDNFERALRAAEQTKNFDALVGGLSGTLKQMQTFLQKSGVIPIEAVGKEFDPNFHEAIGHTESETYPANTVAEEVQRGYVMHDRVLRPTLVKVSQG